MISLVYSIEATLQGSIMDAELENKTELPTNVNVVFVLECEKEQCGIIIINNSKVSRL